MISWTSPLHDQTVTKTFVIAHNDAFRCILDISDATDVPQNVFRSCTLIEDLGFIKCTLAVSSPCVLSLEVGKL